MVELVVEMDLGLILTMLLVVVAVVIENHLVQLQEVIQFHL